MESYTDGIIQSIQKTTNSPREITNLQTYIHIEQNNGYIRISRKIQF